jgi:DNA-binding NtrC family response regulator
MLDPRPKVGRREDAMAGHAAGGTWAQAWFDTGPWVLIVDEDLNAGRVLARMLEDAGYGAVCASSCESARALISTCPIDIVITDVFIPGMCGLALIEFVRRRTLGIPVVVKADERWRSSFDPQALIQRLGAHAMIQPRAESTAILEVIGQVLRQAGRGGVERRLAAAA